MKIKDIIAEFNLLIPFLEPYPSWVKAVIAIWIVLTAVMIISLLFCHPPRKSPVNKEPSETPSTPILTTITKPVLELNVDLKKILTLENKSPTDLKDISIFVTRYVFDENCFGLGKELKIKEYSKIGGSLYNIPTLEAKIGKKSFDLTKHSLIKIYEKPFEKDDYTPAITFYCLRVTYRETNTGTKYVNYVITASYKDYPSLIENQETTASCGTIEGDFMYEIPEVIKKHQKTIFGE